MAEKKDAKTLIIETIKEKIAVKQEIYKNMTMVFRDLKHVVTEITDELCDEAKEIKEVIIEYKERSNFEIELKIAGDILVFSMHTNIFDFENSHEMYKTTYVKDDHLRSYCGVIHIYNFLSDSFKYNRSNDIGYLVARIFVNKDMHYFVEGKRQLGFLYNDFANSVIDKKEIRKVIESAILYSLSFDLLTPPYQAVQEMSVGEMLQMSSDNKIRTGKRLGFKFQADNDYIE